MNTTYCCGCLFFFIFPASIRECNTKAVSECCRKVSHRIYAKCLPQANWRELWKLVCIRIIIFISHLSSTISVSTHSHKPQLCFFVDRQNKSIRRRIQFWAFFFLFIQHFIPHPFEKLPPWLWNKNVKTALSCQSCQIS